MLASCGHPSSSEAFEGGPAPSPSSSGPSFPGASSPCPSHLPALTGDAKEDASNLADALSALAQDRLLAGIKAMTTDLDKLFLDLKREFEEQVALCDRFRQLALAYRPIRNEAVSAVLWLKDFADTATHSTVPLLKGALDDGNVDDVAELIHELVDNYRNVHARLVKLKKEHNEITIAARKLSDQAARKAQEHLALQETADQKARVSAVIGAAAGSEAALVGATMAFGAGAGPVGWLCLGVGGAVAVGAGGTLIHQEATFNVESSLVKSATKINQLMNSVTVQLEIQCSALEMIVTKVETCSGSTERIQALVDAWTAEGAKRTKMQEKKLKLWLDKLFPDAMVDLSKYCAMYLGDEAKERERMITAMNLSIEPPTQPPTTIRTFSSQKSIICD